ncbi:MAG: aldehyde dehydrogenase family protein, partial [bacterium]|nr:aldehyde dehydrogenase family protein [bacterium]
FHWAAWADKYGGTVQRPPVRMLVTAINEPIGVIGIRAPDEWPLLGLVSTIAPAIAMGNTVVAVAGSHALTASDFIQVLQNSDVPGGVVNVLTAEKPDAVAELLARNRDVDAVWCFGGDAAVAKVEAASVSNMKRTWCATVDWMGAFGASKVFLRKATQVKNVWVPFGA